MLDDAIGIELRIMGCFGDQSGQAVIIELIDARTGAARKTAAFDLDEMTHQRGQCNSRIKANDDLAGTFLATPYAGGLSMTIERAQNGSALVRIVKPENQLGELIQSQTNLQRDTEKIMRARVVRVGRNSAWVVCDEDHTARLASLRRKGANLQSMLVSGDLVDVRPLEDGNVVVERVHPRTFELQRRTAGGRTKIMAANVDTIAIVAAMVSPPIRRSLIDQLIAFAELAERKVLLLLTKIDLTDGVEAEQILRLYRSLGYTALGLQPKRAEGVADLVAALDDTRALLVGQSGVGKSSIFRALGGATDVGEVSSRGRGRQTTTAARLLQLGSGFLIDSPGVGAFELGDVPSRELSQAFVEFPPFAEGCRFRDCAHLTEPGCAVRTAAEEGRIAAGRYESYRLILARADPLSAYS